MKPAAHKKTASPLQLTWTHLGLLYRVSAWPDVELEVQRDGRWISLDPNPASEVFSAAAVMIGRAEWTRYLDFLPERERRLIERFRFQRLATLVVITRCPELLDVLEEAPALAPFLAAHAELRGSPLPRWSELRAIHERSGIFGVLEWLGLPASRRSLEALSELTDADLPKRLLTRVREALWNPLAADLLHHAHPRNDRELAARCEVLAA